MPAIKNTRHERFAQELARGETADAAYQTAGYAENRGNAIRLKANERVVKRVAEIQERAAARTEITVAGMTARLLRIVDKTEGADDAALLSVARASIMDAAKLNGLIVDKVSARVERRPVSLTDEELHDIATGSGAGDTPEASRPH